MPNSPRLNWPVPSEGADPWFDAFERLIEAQDSTVYASREDRNIVVMKGGIFSLSGGSISWADTIELFSPITGVLWTLAPGSIVLADSEVFYVELNRRPQQNSTLVPLKSTKIPTNDTALLMGIRRSDRVYFREGKVLIDGQNVELFESDTGGGTGFTNAGDGLYSSGLTVHVGDGAGIITNPDNIAIDLDTNSGLELNPPAGTAGKLKVLPDPAGSLALSAAGIRVLIDTVLPGNPTLQSTGVGLSVLGVPINFKINGTATASTVTATNLDTLTDGSTGVTLHVHPPADALTLFNSINNIIGGDIIEIADPVSATGTASRVIKGRADDDARSRIIGVSRTQALSGGISEVVSLGIIPGILTAATPGQAFFLQPSGGISATAPGPVNRIIRCGWAINTTDLFVQITDLGKDT
jgi:hypothetical protein